MVFLDRNTCITPPLLDDEVLKLHQRPAFWRISLLPSKVMISHSMNLQGLISNQNMILGYPWYVRSCQVQNSGQKIHRRSLHTRNVQSIWICFRFVKWVSFIYIPCIAVSDFTGERPHVLLKLGKKNITILISSIRLNTFSCLTSTFFPEKKHHQQSRPTVSLVVSTLNMQHNHRIHEGMTYFQEISNRTHWTDPEKTWVSNS